MTYYTKEHAWLEPKGDELLVGITLVGDDLLGGLVYADVMDNKLELESQKTSMTLDLPVDGELEYIGGDLRSCDEPLAKYKAGYRLDTTQVMTSEEYDEFVKEVK